MSEYQVLGQGIKSDESEKGEDRQCHIWLAKLLRPNTRIPT